MDEMDLTLPPELESSLDDFYATPEPDPAFASRLDLDLLRRFDEDSSQKCVSRRTFMQTLRARPALALLIVLLAIGLLSGAAYAISRLTGFIPGFGFTSGAGEVYVLTEPVSASVDEVTLRVENAVDDGSRFWVELTRSGTLDQPEFSHIDAHILLADGQRVDFLMGGDSDSSASEVRMTFEFSALPTGTEALTLQLRFATREGNALRSVDIPLRLRPIRQGELIPSLPTETTSLQSETHDGLTLVLQNVAADRDKTILQVALRFDAQNAGLLGDWNVTLTDESGAVYPLLDISPASTDGTYRRYQAPAFTGSEMLILSLAMFPYGEEIHMYAEVPDGAGNFTFDPGPNPQPGQRWSLDETVQIGAFTLHAVGAQLVTPTELLFEFEPVGNVTGVMLYSPDPLLRGASGGVPVESGNFTAGITLESFPTHPFEVQAKMIYYTGHGPWQIKWHPPAAPEMASGLPTSTPAPTPKPYNTSTFVSSDPILLEVQSLAQKFDAPFQQGPGWVHVLNETVTENEQPGRTYPPPYLTSEQWYELDENGYVQRSTWIDRDENGNILQMSATVGDYSVNFTSGDAGYNQGQLYRYSADMLTRDLASAPQYDTQVTREEAICNDKSPCLLITMSDTFLQPAQNNGPDQPITGAGRRIWINLQTGQQVQIQAFWRLANGSEQVDFTQRILQVEKLAAPPQEILDLLTKVIRP